MQYENPREYILIRDISLERGKESENSYIVGVGKNNDGVAVLLKQKDGRLEEMKVHKKAKSSLYIQLCLCAPFYVLANLVCGYTPEYDGIQNYDYIQPVISDTTIDGAFQRVVHLRAMGIKHFVESQLAEVVEEEKVDSAPCCTIS